MCTLAPWNRQSVNSRLRVDLSDDCQLTRITCTLVPWNRHSVDRWVDRRSVDCRFQGPKVRVTRRIKVLHGQDTITTSPIHLRRYPMMGWILKYGFQVGNYPFHSQGDQRQRSPPASLEISHHTVWRTWLFIAYSDERWLTLSLLSSKSVFSQPFKKWLYEWCSENL